MKIRGVELRNREDEDRPLCSWPNCQRGSRHAAEFEMHSARGWKPRRMGFCDHHRGLFKRKHMSKKR